MQTDAGGCTLFAKDAMTTITQSTIRKLKNSGPDIQFEPALMEAVVTRALADYKYVQQLCSRLAQTSDSSNDADNEQATFDVATYHAEAESIYQIRPVEQRAARFRELYKRWFYLGQFNALVADAFVELPEITRNTSVVTVTRAVSSAEERADLSSHTGSAVTAQHRKHWIGIRVMPARFLAEENLRPWLRHELWHVRDMLDPVFAYRRDELSQAAGNAERLPERVVQDRYSLFWALSIDVRIERAGLKTLRSPVERRARLAQAFRNISPDVIDSAIETLGHTRGLTHPELLELARHPRQLFGQNSPQDGTTQPLSGTTCPLCRFPTFEWAELTSPTSDTIIAGIRRAYPHWSPELGVCSTCCDLFRIREGIWS